MNPKSVKYRKRVIDADTNLSGELRIRYVVEKRVSRFFGLFHSWKRVGGWLHGDYADQVIEALKREGEDNT